LSLKQDIEMVKEELNSEEKFFEKAVLTERFVKKYKLDNSMLEKLSLKSMKAVNIFEDAMHNKL